MLTSRSLLAFLVSSGIALRVEAQPAENPPPETSPTQVQAGGSVTIQAQGPVTVVESPAPAAPPPPAEAAPVARAPEAAPSVKASPDEDPDVNASMPKRAHLALSLGGGASIHSFHSDAVYMGGAFIGLGVDTKVGSFDGTILAEGGRTEQGLHTWRADVGAQLSWLVGPVRLGFGPRGGFFDVSRITASESLLYMTFGLDGLASVDVYHGDGFELALALRPRAQWASTFLAFGPGDSTGLLGGTLGMEIRWRKPRSAASVRPRLRASR